MNLSVVQTYVGRPTPLGPPESGLLSSIAKTPTERSELKLTFLNLEGDDQADRRVHGGLQKAVYVHPSENLASWAEKLNQPEVLDQAISAFGENLSTTGATEKNARIGDIWTLGSARLQIVQPRWPCQKLVIHRKTPRVAATMRSEGMTGWYLQVLEPGVVPTQGEIEVEPDDAGVSVLDANSAMLDRHLRDRDLVERVASVGALAQEWRLPLSKRLSS